MYLNATIRLTSGGSGYGGVPLVLFCMRIKDEQLKRFVVDAGLITKSAIAEAASVAQEEGRTLPEAFSGFLLCLSRRRRLILRYCRSFLSQ